MVEKGTDDQSAEPVSARIVAGGHAPDAPTVDPVRLPRRGIEEHGSHRHHLGAGAVAVHGAGATGATDRDVRSAGVVVGGVLRALRRLVRSQDGTAQRPHHLGLHQLDHDGFLGHRR